MKIEFLEFILKKLGLKNIKFPSINITLPTFYNTKSKKKEIKNGT